MNSTSKRIGATYFDAAVAAVCFVAASTVAVAAKSSKKPSEPVPTPSSLNDLEPKAPAVTGDFSIVALPDTRFHTAASNGPLSQMLLAQTEWIISNHAGTSSALRKRCDEYRVSLR